jgi:HAMP domain-containing protein
MTTSGAGSIMEAIRSEAAATKETADHMANGETPSEADEVRVLAGMVRQLADQVERLAAAVDGSGGAANG